MKFTSNKLSLLKEVSQVLPFVERKTTIPILSNLLVTADHDHVAITATDLEHALRVEFEAKVANVGTITIPARKLADVLKTLKTVDADEVTIEELEHNWIRVTCGPLNVKLAGMKAENYPSLPSWPTDKPSATIAKDVLPGLIRRTRYAIAQQESRYTLNGALLIVGADSIQMVATDGHRCAHASHNGTYAQASRTLIAAKVIDLLPDGDAIEIAKDDTRVFFRSRNWTMTSRIMTGQYPNWEMVMPKQNANVIVLDGAALSQTVERVAQFADERTRAVRLEMLPGKGLQVSASSLEMGEASETLPVPGYDGHGIAIGFHASYVLDVLKSMSKGQQVAIKVRDAQSGALFVPLSDGEYQTECVVMPLRM